MSGFRGIQKAVLLLAVFAATLGEATEGESGS